MINKNMRTRDHLVIFCNSCKKIAKIRITKDLREGLICPDCGLNARARAVLYATQKISFFSKFAGSSKIYGISDGEPLSISFRKRFGSRYKNFEYHKEPYLDITKPISNLKQAADIVICSEVLEHVKPPVLSAFQGLYQLLKPGGWLVLSVPHSELGTIHIEHFPELLDSEIEFGTEPTLKGVDHAGAQLEFTNLIFHGGVGSTLEYRVFSEDSLRSNLLQAGFVKPRILPNNRYIGCVWEPWSRVWTAQKPKTKEESSFD